MHRAPAPPRTAPGVVPGTPLVSFPGRSRVCPPWWPAWPGPPAPSGAPPRGPGSEAATWPAAPHAARISSQGAAPIGLDAVGQPDEWGHGGCPVVALTSSLLGDERAALLRAGAAAVLLKGTAVPALLAAMAAALTRDPEQPEDDSSLS